MLAAFAGQLDMVKYLRTQGASWEARDLRGRTALHWAAGGGHCCAIEWMIDDSCNVGLYLHLYILQRRQHCPKCEKVNFLYSCSSCTDTYL